MLYDLSFWVIFIIIGWGIRIGLGFLPAHFAKKKGYSGVGFFFFGLFFLVPAIITVCVLDDKNAPKPQPQVVNNSPVNLSKENNPQQEASNDIDAQIRQYKQLLDDGLITEEEFALKKKQILNI